jgi:replication-associated recombination protein RarA
VGNPNHFKLKNAPGGYYKDEVISALQKAIRRSDERRAVYWATVLELEGKKMAVQMWNRMLVIANEDIGPADSSVIVKIKTL